MHRIIAVALVAAAVAVAPTSAQAQDKDIVETAVAAGSFKTLATALEKTDLIATLKGTGPFTVFAPTDAAFAKLPAGTLDKLLANPDQLKAILLYHVVAGEVTAAQASKLTSAKTVNGADIKIMAMSNGVMINQANVVTADVKATNGVIHVLDAVILPPAKP
ncbi:MAG: fasciclin domain-containing protein [Gemmatimonadetes bacterium]|nr:fasciclin domain-containing protein [Gemmatimonadota bacterium]MCC6771338.1 fasciclin domain-containing protein [Gemmatimonadaceae bacterium]